MRWFSLMLSLLLLSLSVAAGAGPEANARDQSAVRPAPEGEGAGISASQTGAFRGAQGNEWTKTSPAVGPSARYAHAMVHDEKRGENILYGGRQVTPFGYDTWAYNLTMNSWRSITPPAVPHARYSHAMAYDSGADRVVLFGGADLLNGTWVFDPAAGTWTDMAPGVAPSGRHDHAMAYDAASGQVVLFGGVIGPLGSSSAETWVYDVAANTWTNRTPAVGPSARFGHAMVYAADASRIVLFGGAGVWGRSNETWTYDVVANSWTNVTPSVSPSPRYFHAMTYDSRTGLVLLFGGDAPSNETWVYNLAANTWTQMTPVTAPAARYGHAMTYDPVAAKTVLFGGRIGWGPADESAETWIYDAVANAWAPMRPPPAPSPRGFHAVAYDAAADLMVLFSGWTTGGPLSPETWTYRPEANQWTKIAGASGPSPRSGHAMAWDENARMIVLFGGQTDAGGNDETWAYDLGSNSWTNMAPASAPSRRSFHSMAYDARSGRIVLFGGFLPDGNLSSETWTYDLSANTWRRMAPATGPSARMGHSMVYDPGTAQVVLFGGMTRAGRSAETWAYSISASVWTKLPITIAPAPRDAHAMAYAATAGKIILFGGSTNATATAETWVYDSVANVWTNLTPITGPSGRFGHSVAYAASIGRVILFGGVTGPGTYNGETWWYQPPLLAPSPPLDLQASAGTGQVVLTWLPPATDGGSPIAGYRIYRGTASVTLSLLAEASAALAYTDTAVMGGVTYHYAVSAMNSVGESPRSTTISVTPLFDTMNPAVTIAVPSSGAILTTRTVTFSGTASDDVAVASVKLSTDGATWVLATGTTSWNCTLTVPEGRSTILVRVTDTSGNTQTVGLAITVQGDGAGAGTGLLVFAAVVLAAAAVVGTITAYRIRRR